jgi:hypothetical protein
VDYPVAGPVGLRRTRVQMGAVIDDILKSLEKMGRVGGLLALLLAFALAGSGAWGVVHLGPWNGGPVWSPGGTGAAASAIGLSLVAALLAVRLLSVRGVARPQPLSAPVFAEQAAVAKKPFRVCLDCRVFLEPFGPCGRCGNASGAMEVRDESDMKLLRASLPDS